MQTWIYIQYVALRSLEYVGMAGWPKARAGWPMYWTILGLISVTWGTTYFIEVVSNPTSAWLCRVCSTWNPAAPHYSWCLPLKKNWRPEKLEVSQRLQGENWWSHDLQKIPKVSPGSRGKLGDHEDGSLHMGVAIGCIHHELRVGQRSKLGRHALQHLHGQSVTSGQGRRWPSCGATCWVFFFPVFPNKREGSKW